MDVSTEFRMSRGEAWRGAFIPRHWVLALVTFAGCIVLPDVLFTQPQPLVSGPAVPLVVILTAFALGAYVSSESFDVTTTVTLTDTTLSVVRPSGTMVVPWSEVTQFTARHRHWIVRKGKVVAIIPMRVFDADDRAAIALLMRQVGKS